MTQSISEGDSNSVDDLEALRNADQRTIDMATKVRSFLAPVAQYLHTSRLEALRANEDLERHGMYPVWHKPDEIEFSDPEAVEEVRALLLGLAEQLPPTDTVSSIAS